MNQIGFQAFVDFLKTEKLVTNESRLTSFLKRTLTNPNKTSALNAINIENALVLFIMSITLEEAKQMAGSLSKMFIGKLTEPSKLGLQKKVTLTEVNKPTLKNAKTARPNESILRSGSYQTLREPQSAFSSSQNNTAFSTSGLNNAAFTSPLAKNLASTYTAKSNTQGPTTRVTKPVARQSVGTRNSLDQDKLKTALSSVQAPEPETPPQQQVQAAMPSEKAQPLKSHNFSKTAGPVNQAAVRSSKVLNPSDIVKRVTKASTSQDVSKNQEMSSSRLQDISKIENVGTIQLLDDPALQNSEKRRRDRNTRTKMEESFTERDLVDSLKQQLSKPAVTALTSISPLPAEQAQPQVTKGPRKMILMQKNEKIKVDLNKKSGGWQK